MVVFVFYHKLLPDTVFQGQLYKVFFGSEELFICLYIWSRKWTTAPNRTRILWHSDDVKRNCSYSGCLLHTPLNLPSTLLRSTLCLKRFPQASFFLAPSLVSQWGTLAGNWRKEEIEVGIQSDLSLDTTHVRGPSPHSPFGPWFQ